MRYSGKIYHRHNIIQSLRFSTFPMIGTTPENVRFFSFARTHTNTPAKPRKPNRHDLLRARLRMNRVRSQY
jgi:hypothetical protein